MKADVGGTTAGYDDLASRISSKLPLQILVVIALSFVLLILAFRSVVIPPQAAVDEPALDRRVLRRADGDLPVRLVERRDRSRRARCRSSPTCRCSCSRSCSGSRWTTRYSSSARSRSTCTPARTTAARSSSGLVTSARVITAAALIMVFVFGIVRAQRRPDGQAVRDRPRGRGDPRRDRRPVPARAGAR